MSTVSGANMRRYHGLLVAAVRPPEDRMVLLSSFDEEVSVEGQNYGLSTNQYAGTVHPEGYQFLEEFKVGEDAFWSFRVAGATLEKRVKLHPRANTVTIQYQNSGPKPLRLTLRPLVCHKPYHENFGVSDHYPTNLKSTREETLVEHGRVPLRLIHPGAELHPAVGWYFRFEHRRESERGLDPRVDLFCPVELHYSLAPGASINVVATIEKEAQPWTDWDDSATGIPPNAVDALTACADHFLVETESRTSIIAGYPWFTDWGRDTMISLPGLLLCTGRAATARKILSDYATQMKGGLIPNRFVEVGEPEYNTADATLWFANAIYETLNSEWNQEFASSIHASLVSVFEHHIAGTLYNIKVDPSDGLLYQGAEGVQLTWMDAKVGDWVVTPRRGKAVEINGLWINACRVLAWLSDKLGLPADVYTQAADRAEESFHEKFWRANLGYYLDIVEPDDSSLRPNQLIAMSLAFGPMRKEQAAIALEIVGRELLTPVGMRTLGPHIPGYKPQFRGPIVELDAAYHQGTVWPWLMGPYVGALLRVTGDTTEARRILRNCRNMMTEFGIGGLAEVYDGDEPRHPAGCPWQAWSVAEWLRAATLLQKTKA